MCRAEGKAMTTDTRQLTVSTNSLKMPPPSTPASSSPCASMNCAGSGEARIQRKADMQGSVRQAEQLWHASMHGHLARGTGSPDIKPDQQPLLLKMRTHLNADAAVQALPQPIQLVVRIFQHLRAMPHDGRGISTPARCVMHLAVQAQTAPATRSVLDVWRRHSHALPPAASANPPAYLCAAHGEESVAAADAQLSGKALHQLHVAVARPLLARMERGDGQVSMNVHRYNTQ